jgi:hypothetical protein
MFLCRHTNKAVVLASFFKARYEKGLRGKAATEMGASVRIHFKMALHSADFCNAPMVKRARSACKMSTYELRVCQLNEKMSQTRLPVWEGHIDELIENLWEKKAWTWGDMDDRMIYMCLEWGYDLAVRVSECALAEDHNIRAFQVVLRLRSAVSEDGHTVLSVRGGSRACKL